MVRFPNSLLVFLFLTAVLPAGAYASQRRVSVAQLEETLGSAFSSHKNEADIARLVGGLEMTERLSSPELDRIAARFPLKPQTALALQLLADQSEFLEPPAAELPATSSPSADDERRMLSKARAYAVETWSRLPNFFVTRNTTHFSDGAVAVHKGEWPVRSGLHALGSLSRQVTFHDGKEVADTSADAAKAVAAEKGLRSWGEFGPALTVVLADTAGQTVKFTHWEQTPSGLAAVFHYEVPSPASHYAVSYCCLVQVNLGSRVQYGYGGRNRTPQQMANIPRDSDSHTFVETPGYHGSIAIDPDSGAILRLTIDADLSKADPLLRAQTMIAYGPVKIGDRSFVLPVKGLAVSVEPGEANGCHGGHPMTLNGVGDDTAWQNGIGRCDNNPLLRINETVFAQYHRLGSTTRILSDSEASALDGSPNVRAQAEVAANSSETPAKEESAETSTPSAEPPAMATAPTPVPPPAAPPAVPEISMSAASGIPDQPSAGSQNGFSLRVTTRLVDVGVIVTDKKGQPVPGLRAEDFEVFDSGRKQEIKSFSAPAIQTATSTAEPSVEVPPAAFSNRGESAPMQASAPSGGNLTVLLIDEGHIAWPDLTNARAQMVKFVKAAGPSERIGLYSMNELGFHVLLEPTADHAGLAARLEKFTPTAQSVSRASEEEKRNRQQFEEVHSAADLNSVNGNHTEVPDADQSVDPQLMTMGSDPARAAMVVLSQVARHLAALAGHKNVVWVSSDNVFADWGDQAVGIEKSPRAMESFSHRVQEAMNDAHASVYPFDVSQLEGGAITADVRHRNVELTQAASDNAATAAGASGSGPAAGGRSMQPGRIQAEMSQDLHPIQGSVREIATGTGGRTIRRSGDLAAELNGIVTDGQAIYRLSFSPEGQADDQYHPISVKLVGHKNVTARFRAGYIFTREPDTLKERFQQAVWRPVDVNEIALKAEPGTSIKLNIAAADLAMEQQGDRWMDKLDIFFIQRDDAGLHAKVEGQTLGLRLKPATYENVLKGGVPFERVVAMKPGMGSLRVLVVDENSGRMGSVTLPATSVPMAK